MSASWDDFGIAIRSALLQKGAKQKFSLFFLICFSIVIFFLDNFPIKPVSDKWRNLFLKKIISDESSLVMASKLNQEIKVLKDFLPIFNIKYKEGIDLINFNDFSRYENGTFKSSFIATNDMYNVSKDYISKLNDVIDWILKDTDIQYSFHIANKDKKLDEAIFIYGYSNLVDS